MSARHADLGCLVTSNPTADAAQPPPRASFKASTAVPCAPAIAVAGAAEATTAAVAGTATSCNGEQAAISRAAAHAAALEQAGPQHALPARRRGQCQCCSHHGTITTAMLFDGCLIAAVPVSRAAAALTLRPAARRRPAAAATNGAGAALAACRV